MIAGFAAIMQQFYEAEIQKPEFRRTMHHAYTDSAVSARQVYSGLKNSMVNATKEERAVANEQIIETAFMQYTNTILDSLDAPERVHISRQWKTGCGKTSVAGWKNI